MIFDAFLSHKSSDKPAVRQIRDGLQKHGLKCWLDEDELRAGSDWMSHLEKGLNQSKSCVIFYGSSGIGAWHEMERQLAEFMAVEAWREGCRFGIIPVRLPGAPEWKKLSLPPFLRLYSVVNFSSLTDRKALNALAAGITQEVPMPVDTDNERPPYVGMRPFVEADGHVYTGRSNYIIHLCDQLASREAPRFSAVLGASGSGKSSLLSAGLLPRLKEGNPRIETKNWQYISMRPGSDAMSSLRAALRGNHIIGPHVEFQSNTPKTWLNEVSSAALGTGHDASRLILIVDQFEELLTSCPGGKTPTEINQRNSYLASTWRPFCENLAHAAVDPSGPVTVLISMRSDFLPDLPSDDALAHLLSDQQRRCLVMPLDESEVRNAIEWPAISKGLSLDPALVEAVTQDYQLDPAGALPFLQEALYRVWEARQGNELCYADYRQFGGLRGAVNAHANSILEDLSQKSPEQASLVKPLFLHLTRISGDGGHDTKRRRLVDELPGNEPMRVLARTLSNPDCRLLLFDDYQDSSRSQSATSTVHSPATSIEIAHESLLSGWQLLNEWLHEDRAERIRLRRLEEQSVAYRDEDKNHQPPLLRGKNLRQAERLCAIFENEVTPAHYYYLNASHSAARWQIVIRSSGVLLVIIVGFFIFKLGQEELDPEAKRLADLKQQLAAVPNTMAEAPTRVSLARSIVAIDPSDSTAWEIQVKSMLKVKHPDFTEINNVLNEWSGKDTSSPANIISLRGDLSNLEGKTEETIDHWSKYASTEELSSNEKLEVWRKLIPLLVTNDEWQAARTWLDHWIKEKDSLEARVQRIKVLRNLYAWEEMNADIRWLESNHPGAPETIQLRTKKADSRVSYFEMLILENSKNPMAWSRKAMFLAETGNLQAARAELRKGIKQDADSALLKIQASFLDWLEGENDYSFKKVVSSHWKWSREIQHLGATTRLCNQEHAALQSIEDLIIAKGGPSASLLELRAKELIRLGQTQLAQIDLTKASQFPQNSKTE